MNDSSIAIHAAGVTVQYGRRVAVADVSLNVPSGSIYALLGRNGAGKSSLVRCILGQQLPSRGSVDLFGEDVWSRRATLMQRVGVVSEEADAPPSMRVAQLARFSSKFYPRWDQQSVDLRLHRFEIEPRARFGELSKGQKKQVSLAIALASKPELLILDDPTLGLDAVARQLLFDELIGDIADRGTTVLLTTHDLAGVERIADRVAILHGGRVVFEEEVDALKSRFRRIRFAQPQLAWPDAAVLAVRRWGSGGTEAVVTNYDTVSAELEASEVVPMSLEEIFVAVTGGQQ
jgi:ABC-2 type transport system ATP-binding protein